MTIFCITDMILYFAFLNTTMYMHSSLTSVELSQFLFFQFMALLMVPYLWQILGALSWKHLSFWNLMKCYHGLFLQFHSAPCILGDLNLQPKVIPVSFNINRLLAITVAHLGPCSLHFAYLGSSCLA